MIREFILNDKSDMESPLFHQISNKKGLKTIFEQIGYQKKFTFLGQFLIYIHTSQRVKPFLMC